MVKYVECAISSERYPQDDCWGYSGKDKWVSKEVMSHMQKCRLQMKKKGLRLSMNQYREFMGYVINERLKYLAPSNVQLNELEVFLIRQLP